MTLHSTGGLDVPLKTDAHYFYLLSCHYTVIIFTHPSISQILQSELVREFRGRHCVGQVLLICENQQCSVPQLVLLQLRKDVD